MAGPRVPQVLAHRDFRFFTSARVLWQLGSQLLTVAVGYNVYRISGDPLQLGLVGLAGFLPSIILFLPAGELADTHDRRRVLTICYGLLSASAVLLVVASALAPASTLPMIAIMVFIGTARAVALPATHALLPNLVPPAELPSAIAVASTLNKVAAILGPAIGGLLLVLGPEVPYLAGAIVLGIATLFTARITSGGGRASGATRERVTVESLLSGMVFIRHQPVVLGVISLDLFAVLFGGAVALLPIYALDILQVGPSGLGVLRSAPAFGALATAGLMSFRPIHRKVGIWLFGSVTVFGLSTTVFALSTEYVLSLAALVVVGGADMISVYVRQLIVQFATPDAIRGRVSAVSAMFVGASNDLGEFESGLTAAWWAPVPAAVLGGVLTIVVAGLWAVLFPGLRTMDTFPSRADAPPPSKEARLEGDPA